MRARRVRGSRSVARPSAPPCPPLRPAFVGQKLATLAETGQTRNVKIGLVRRLQEAPSRIGVQRGGLGEAVLCVRCRVCAGALNAVVGSGFFLCLDLSLCVCVVAQLGGRLHRQTRGVCEGGAACSASTRCV